MIKIQLPPMTITGPQEKFLRRYTRRLQIEFPGMHVTPTVALQNILHRAFYAEMRREAELAVVKGGRR